MRQPVITLHSLNPLNQQFNYDWQTNMADIDFHLLRLSLLHFSRPLLDLLAITLGGYKVILASQHEVAR